MNAIGVEKVEQAVRILNELDIDAWLTFARETTESGDPVLPIIVGHPVTWQSAFLVTRGGDRIAIVGKYEDEAIRSTGVWSEVVPYVEGIRAPLRAALERIDPGRIAVNYSVDDVKADGLSHGLWLLLFEHLEGTPYHERFESAGELIRRLRCRKTPAEVERMRAAIAATDEIFASTAAFVRPGTSEVAVHEFMHAELARRGIEPSWEAAMCPIVTTGPDSMVGHGVPSAELSVRPGNVLHLDFGVRRHEYSSDLQRSWYVPRAGEHSAPDDVQRVFDAVRTAIEAAFSKLAPGTAGHEVDAAARASLVGAGFPEYQHATGHHVGRAAHDGGGVLGPRWERYGRTPEFPVEPGNVVTLELGVDIPDRGYLGLEEMALVTESGAEWLSTPQTELLLLAAS